MLIYGSEALKHWYSDYKRIPNDLDIILKEKTETISIETDKRIETYYLEVFDFLFKHNKDNLYVDPDFLYTIKLSHLSWNINWDKHMHDVIFLKSKGCKLHKEFYNSLMPVWSELHGKKYVKMNVKNEDFFKENITRKYDHEYLHECFSFYERPLNERIREDLGRPLCSENLWNKLSYKEKLECAQEELMVLTAERLILIDKPYPVDFARTKMLKHMITSTTSGWFNLFLKENFMELRNLPEWYKQRLEKLK